jgi:hypothetical protein
MNDMIQKGFFLLKNKMTEQEIVRLLNITKRDRILDIGGSMKQHAEIAIDTLADIISPKEAPYGTSELKAKKFLQIDFTKDKLPFKDKEFDVCLCTHTLEDLPSPFLIISEMSRVARRGLIVTPSMGYDMQHSHLDYTDWLTGARRVPGEAHHKWFYVKNGNSLEIIPKNYPILYTSHFQITQWSGDTEMVYRWNGKINYKEFISLNIHKLIDRYMLFVNKNNKYIKKGRTLIFIDNPFIMFKAFVKKLLKKGWGYSFRKTL